MSAREANQVTEVEFRDPAPRAGGVTGPRGSKYDKLIAAVVAHPGKYGVVFRGATSKAASGTKGRLAKMYELDGGKLDFLVRDGEVFARFTPDGAEAEAVEAVDADASVESQLAESATA